MSDVTPSAEREPIGRPEVIALGAILLAAVAVRVLLLTHHSLRNNDFITIDVMHLGLWEIVQERLSRNHMPLYFLQLKAWVGLVGGSEAALRLPSALAGVVGIAALWWVGRMLFGPAAGLTAALLGAAHQQWLEMGADVRMYSQAMTLTLMTVGCAWRWFETRRRAWAWACGVMLLLGLATHLLLLSVSVSLLAVWLISWRDRERDRAWPTVAVLAAPILVVLPLMFAWSQMQYKVGQDDWSVPSLGRLLRNVLVIAFGDHDALGDAKDLIRVVTYPLLAMTVVAVVMGLRAGRRRGFALLAWLIGLPLLAVYAVSFKSGSTIGSSRYLCVAGAALPIAVAAACWSLPWPRARWGAAMLCVAATLIQSGAHIASPGDGVREAMAFLDREEAPGRVAIAGSSTAVYEAFNYYQVAMPMVPLDRMEENPDVIRAVCREALGDGERLYLFLYHTKRSPAAGVLRHQTPWLAYRETFRHGESRVLIFERVTPAGIGN